MVFLEKELVNLFVEQERYYFLRKFMAWHREYQLGPYRFDLYAVSKNNRAHHVIEAKVVADVHSAVQLLKYRDRLNDELGAESFFVKEDGEHSCRQFMVIGSIIAQHFTEDCLYLCRELGIPCSIIAPVNKEFAKVIPVIAHNKLNYRKQLGLKPKNSDFIKAPALWSYDHG